MGPVANGVVPQPAVYHSQVAPLPSDPPPTVSVEESPPHTVDGMAVDESAATENVLAVTATEAHVVVSQPSALTK